ncbi:MAG: glycosyltransferase family 9 protein [Ferruginibacter sp.]
MINASTINILLVQLFSNGDCLYATVVARQIKEDYPNCKLTWAISDFCKNIIANNPYVDEILVTNEVAKNDVVAFRKYKKKVFAEKAVGKWDEVFVTTNMDTNLALYDGTIRGMILRAYPNRITVPLQPVLALTVSEKDNVALFAKTHSISHFKNVILWEFAPQSRQTELNFEMVMSVAKKITSNFSTCVILSSANKFQGTDSIIDASTLSIRENAALTHYCSLLIGCSSGITWLTTSSPAKFLPMLQLLNANTIFINTPSLDFERYNIKHNGLIEMCNFNEDKILSCVNAILNNGFFAASAYNQQLPLQFNTTSTIVYNLLVYLAFSSIKKHYRIITTIYGRHPLFLRAFIKGFVTMPIKLSKNLWHKNYAPKSKCY